MVRKREDKNHQVPKITKKRIPLRKTSKTSAVGKIVPENGGDVRSKGKRRLDLGKKKTKKMKERMMILPEANILAST